MNRRSCILAPNGENIMAAMAVLDLEFEQLPPAITGLDRYSSALILIRLRGRPVGQALLPVVDGRLGSDNLRDALMNAADSAFWEQWLHDYLGYREGRTASSVYRPVTVAVCTRDRPEDLKCCLDALMRLPDDGQEILIIDNNPTTDATRDLVEDYKGVRYVREDRSGLDFARNCALREASHEIVVFTDDDAAPDPFWLRALIRHFEDPRVACVTGLTMPIELETEAQQWFQHLGGLGRGFKYRVFDSAQHDPLQGWVAGAGVNMAIRRNVLAKIGLFDEALDVGTPTKGGGDTEIFSRVLASGYRIVYEPEALNWHRHRRRWEELRRQLYGYELAGFAIWTRQLLFEGKLEVLNYTWAWFWREVATLAFSVLRRPGSTPLDLVVARFRGAVVGPWAYLYSRWRLRRIKGHW